MALPVHNVVVDGELYKVRRLGPFDMRRVQTAAARMLGPVLKALALSDNAKGFLAALTGGDEAQIAAVLEKDVGAAFAMLGLTFDEFAEKLDAEEVIELEKRLFIGRLNAPWSDARVDIEDEKTYEDVVGALMVKHGHLHGLKLIWAALRVNMGPTTAASPSPSATT
jgi:hypothetical protein